MEKVPRQGTGSGIGTGEGERIGNSSLSTGGCLTSMTEKFVVNRKNI
jgi:hypothetical protein